MLMNFVLGLLTMVICLLMQSILLIRVVRYYVNNEHLIKQGSFWSSLAILKSVMLLLVAGNLLQVAIWALLFLLLGEFELFSEAFYHSAVNFSTLGYGDLVMSQDHRLLGPLESINGVLMIGVSTALLMTALQDTMGKMLRAREGKND